MFERLSGVWDKRSVEFMAMFGTKTIWMQSDGYSGAARTVIRRMLFAIVLLLGARHGWGQAQNSGTVTGRVTDAAGAAVPSATITLRSASQGRVVTVHSNPQGEYVFNAVPLGSYSLKVMAPTFADYIVTQLTVNGGDNTTVDAKLNPAGVSATVTVDVANPTLDTQSATVGMTINSALVDSLPLDGNNVIETAALLPGVTNMVAPTTFTSDKGGPTYNASGARANQNLLLLDGALWNNLSTNTGLNYPPRQGIEEVSVLLNNYKAQYGRNVGSVFNVLTKAGTSTYHGQIWEFAQNSAFNATDYLSHLNPHLVQNQFGATLGGPIKQNKLFFFLTFQDLRMAAVASAQSQTPTYNERGLNTDGTARACVTPSFAGLTCASFAEDGLTNSAGGPILPNPLRNSNTAYNAIAQAGIQAGWASAGNSGTSPCITLLLAQPATTTTTTTSPTGVVTTFYTGIPNAELPSPCFNAVTQNLLKRLPVPTSYLSSSPIPFAVSVAKQPRNDWDGMARIDYILGRHTVAARYYQTAVDDSTANGVSAGTGVANYEINRNVGGIHYGNIDDTWVIAGNMVNTVRVAYKRYLYNITPTDPTSLTSLGANYTDPNHSALPQISINSRFTAGTTMQNYVHSVNENIQVDDTLAVTVGRHNFQFGAEFLRLQYQRIYDQQPAFGYNNTYSLIPAADFILGLPQTATVGNGTDAGAVQHDLYLYAQDDWRVSPRLTINYGVRYEIPFQWYEPNGTSSTFIPGYQSVVFPQAPRNLAFPGDPGIDRSLVGTSYNNVAPRVGLAYDLFGNGRTALRAGGGIFYDAINALVVGVGQPFHYTANINQPTGGISEPLLGQSAIPANYVRGQPAKFVTPYSITFPDANFRTPYSESYNAGIIQEIRKSSSLEIEYVGRVGRHLAAGFDLNPAIYDCSGAYFQANPTVYCNNASSQTASYQARVKYPDFNYGGTGVLDYMTVAHSSYNAAQAIYVGHFKQLYVLASYVYSRSQDDSSNGTYIGNSSDQPRLSSKNAVSDFNATHVFNIGGNLALPKIPKTMSWQPVRAVVNGWSVSGIYNARTGNPFSIYDATDSSLQNEYNEYASYTAGGYTPLSSSRHRTAKVAQWFNVADICNPPQAFGNQANPQHSTCTYQPGNYGTLPRNFFVGPAFIITNLAVQRSFTINRAHLQTFDFRVDAFNALNTPNLGNPGTTLSGTASKNATFGVISATAGSNGAVLTNGRRLQMSGTLRF